MQISINVSRRPIFLLHPGRCECWAPQLVLSRRPLEQTRTVIKCRLKDAKRQALIRSICAVVTATDQACSFASPQRLLASLSSPASPLKQSCAQFSKSGLDSGDRRWTTTALRHNILQSKAHENDDAKAHDILVLSHSKPRNRTYRTHEGRHELYQHTACRAIANATDTDR